MTDPQRPGPAQAAAPGTEPPTSLLRQILQRRPDARPRLGRAVAALLGTALVALAAIGALVIWHLVRRGRLIRQRLSPPRIVRMPELTDREVSAHDQDHGAASTP
jgi:hypothetical protein